MKKCATFAIGLFSILMPISAIEMTSLQNVKFVLADKVKGKELLTTEDDFVLAQSEFDRSARLKVSRSVSKEEYLTFVGEQAMDWTKDEKKTFEANFKKIKSELSKDSLFCKNYRARRRNVCILPQSEYCSYSSGNGC